MSKSVFIACITVAFGYVIFGTSFFFTDYLLRSVSVIDLLAMRFIISFLTFSILRIFKVIKVNFKGKNMLWIFLAAIFEPILYFIFETIGVKYTSTMISGMIIAFTPIVVMILEGIILKEKTNLIQKLFLILGIVGVAIITANGQNDGESTLWGIICLFITATCGASFIVSSRKSSQGFSATEITYFSSMLGMIFFNGLSLINHIANGTVTSYFYPLFNVHNVCCLLYLALSGSIIATAAINYGASKIQASSVSAFSGVSTVTAIFVGVVFNNEKLFFYHIISTVLILISAIGINYTKVKEQERDLIKKQVS
ncbi:MAG: DMT family transporter [Ruminococcaceae bacterium]|nr:DMT family transporter [Oscillospiraceae bacterium]